MNRWDENQLRFDRFDLDLDEAADDAEERAVSWREAQMISEAARRLFAEGGNELAQGWYEDYLKLIEQGWPWRVAVYIAWASSPKQYRWPATAAELATSVLRLTSPRAIYKWRQKYPTIDTVVALMQARPLFEHRRDVINALVEMAGRPDYKSFNDRKLFLEMIGDYTPKSKLELGKSGKGMDLSDLSDEELDQLVGSGKLEVESDPAKALSPEEEEDEDDAVSGTG